ncbi:unnamed protein product [Euphydryas editha]|uniref:Endonuclease/exonuclease/phosphatase domain-containing protein n=1 Tax=Euphydryas editha TaxID=104508 RepID=A0AAU9TG38_EUPED|nr:unnamed protein product [Euphydryas editha]
MLRSPTRSGMSTRRSDSQSDLTDDGVLSETSDIQRIAFRNKRKHPEENEHILVIKEEVSEIKTQIAQMMTLLTSLGTSQKEFMEKMSQDVASMKEQMSNIKSTTNNIIKEQNEIKSDVSSLVDKWTVTEKKLATVEYEIKQLKTEPTSSHSAAIISSESIMEEICERERRKRNLIISGIPEPVSARREERSLTDKSEVMTILRKIYPDCPEPTTTIRLGKYNPKKRRAIKLSFESQETSIHILRNRTNYTSHDNIKIYSDQTPQQREYLKKLKEELKTRSENDKKLSSSEETTPITCHIVSKRKNQISTSNINTYQIAENYNCITTTKKSLRFLYANVRSIVAPGKFDELLCIVKSFKNFLHFIILTETWIKSEDETKRFIIPDYTHYYNYRPNIRGGGVSIFAHDNLKHTLLENKCINGNHLMWISVENFSLNVGVVYRRPDSNIQTFLDEYSYRLNKMKRNIIFGDFNINLLASESEKTISMYKDVLKESGYKIMNKIDKSYCTRETPTTKTIIDHVCYNLKETYFHQAVIESSMSDHKQLYVELKRHQPKTPEKISYEAINYTTLYTTMTNNLNNNTNFLYNLLEESLLKSIARSKTVKYKIQNPPRQDWINKTIINEINCRNYLWKEHKRNINNTGKHEEFIKKRNEVAETIQRTKSTYYLKLFEACNKKPAKMWTLINSLSHNKIKANTGPTKLVINNEEITEEHKICECFNEFFSNIGSSLANKIKKPDFPCDALVCEPVTTTHILSQLSATTTDEISTIIDNLKINTSSGIDGVNTKSYQMCQKSNNLMNLLNV